MEEKRFRGDLFYRINVIEIHVPSLRERKDDIPLLADKILRQLADEWQLPKPQLDAEAITTLGAYDFPGNVRELENILERAFTLCEGNSITSDDLHLPLANPTPVELNDGDDHAANFSTGDSLEKYLEDIERNILQRILDQHRWNRTAAAKSLGMTFRQLRYRLQKLGLDSDGANL
jgi:two-component system response regulator PilR (NtrC family)